MEKNIKIGIIGGSGLDDPKFLTDFEEITIDTPFGATASSLLSGKLNGSSVVILSRHGKNHSLNPTQVPYQANLWALKEAGCTHILATTACGSLRQEIKPGDLVFADQFIDNTKHRALTIHKDKVVHTPMAEPFCPVLRDLLSQTAKELSFACHNKGTVITIEGQRFSTRAESKMFRAWGADIINMSTVPEVIIARELGMCYQIVAMSTDYDSWLEDEEPVTWEMISARMKDNADKVKKLIIEVLPKINFENCECNK